MLSKLSIWFREKVSNITGCAALYCPVKPWKMLLLGETPPFYPDTVCGLVALAFSVIIHALAPSTIGDCSIVYACIYLETAGNDAAAFDDQYIPIFLLRVNCAKPRITSFARTVASSFAVCHIRYYQG